MTAKPATEKAGKECKPAMKKDKPSKERLQLFFN